MRAVYTLVAIAIFFTGVGLYFFTGTAGDGGITVRDAYARASNDRAGAVFMVIENGGPADRLIEARSDAAMKVEIHTHSEVNGVMQMRQVEGGLAVPAGGQAVLKRGGDHVMFMGLSAAWEQGGSVPLTLVFERAGEVLLDVTVDLER